jgi:hypothetical protein
VVNSTVVTERPGWFATSGFTRCLFLLFLIFLILSRFLFSFLCCLFRGFLRFGRCLLWFSHRLSGSDLLRVFFLKYTCM